MRPAMVRSSSSSNSEIIENNDSPSSIVFGPLTVQHSVDNNDTDDRITIDEVPIVSSNKDVLWYPIKLQVPPNWHVRGLRLQVNGASVCTDRPAAAAANRNKDQMPAAKKKYVSYDIQLAILMPHPVDAVAASEGAVIEPTISRRYTAFLDLYTGLRKDHPLLMQGVSFPKKCLIGNFSEDVVTQRAVAFEYLHRHILTHDELRESPHFLRFLEDPELARACQLIDERLFEKAVPILVNCFRLLNRIYTDRSRAVLLVLCRIVAACCYPVPLENAEKWAELALKRYEGVCDADLLPLYVPLIKTCIHLYGSTGRECGHLEEQLRAMHRRGMNVTTGPTLAQAIHALDPRTESA